MVTAAKITLPGWLAELYPYIPYERRTRLGAAMRFLDEGPRGPEAVLMVHGNPTWSFYFRRAVQRLCGQRRCVVPDHIGMGLSEKPEHYPYVLRQRIEDLDDLVEELGLSRVHLLLHDWGGAIGMGWAVRHPEKVGNIVLLNTAAFRSTHIPGRISMCRWPLFGGLLVRGLNGFAGPATWMAMHRTRMAPDIRRAYLWPYGTWADRVAVHGFVRDIPMQEEHPSHETLFAVEQGLATLRDKPMHLFWGGEDFCFDDVFFEEWRRRFPEARARYLDGVGHYVMEDSDDGLQDEIAAALLSELPRH